MICERVCGMARILTPRGGEGAGRASRMSAHAQARGIGEEENADRRRDDGDAEGGKGGRPSLLSG